MFEAFVVAGWDLAADEAVGAAPRTLSSLLESLRLGPDLRRYTYTAVGYTSVSVSLPRGLVGLTADYLSQRGVDMVCPALIGRRAGVQGAGWRGMAPGHAAGGRGGRHGCWRPSRSRPRRPTTDATKLASLQSLYTKPDLARCSCPQPL